MPITYTINQITQSAHTSHWFLPFDSERGTVARAVHQMMAFCGC